MATTLEYDIAVNSAGVESGAAAVDNLGSKLTDTKGASEGLAKSLEKQEARIKIIDGAINLLGGSVELAVGSISALGLVSEEQAEQFQASALGAIAFADGAKRSFDGVKSLTEGFKAYGGIAGAARKAQLALNTAILANPYVAAAVAIGVLVAGLALLVISLNDTEKAERALSAERAKSKGADAEAAELQIRLATARGENTIEIQKQEIAARKLRIEEKAAAIEAEKDSEKRLALAKEYKALVNDNRVARAELATLEKQATEKAAEDRASDFKDAKDKQAAKDELAKQAAEKKAAEDQKAREDQKKADDDRIKATQDTEDKINEILQSESEKQILSVAKTYDDLIEQAMTFGLDTTALEEARGVAIQEVIDAQTAEKQKKQDEANAKEVADNQAVADALLKARTELALGIGAAIGAIGDLFKEGTAAAKTAALAEIAIGTAVGFINALDIAQKSAKGTGPAAAFAFPIFYATQIAAVLGAVASAKQILSTTPGGGGGTTPTKPPTGGAPSIGGGAFTGNLPGTGPTPTTPVTQEPIRAYVVAQDVSTGQEANAAIRRRRRLGGG